MSDSTPSSGHTPIEQLAREWVGQIWDDPEDEFYKVQLLLARVRREALQECEGIVWGVGTTGSKEAARQIRELYQHGTRSTESSRVEPESK